MNIIKFSPPTKKPPKLPLAYQNVTPKWIPITFFVIWILAAIIVVAVIQCR
jgi:hypothetical protein